MANNFPEATAQQELTDEQIAEIEALKAYQYGTIVHLTAQQRNGLCAAVRALKADVIRYKTGFDDYVRKLEANNTALQAELKGLREAVESVCARHTESAKVSGLAKCACLDCTGLRAALHPQPEKTK